MKALAILAATLALTACQKPQPQTDARAEIQKIVREAKAPVTGKLISFRTEPTTSPSHSAVIEASDKSGVYRFSVFRKDAKWYYDGPVSLTSGGEIINITQEDYFKSIFSTVAYNFDLGQ